MCVCVGGSISSCDYGCTATRPDVLFNRDKEILRINPSLVMLQNTNALAHITSHNQYQQLS